jgi:hypothetical protein
MTNSALLFFVSHNPHLILYVSTRQEKKKTNQIISKSSCCSFSTDFFSNACPLLLSSPTRRWITNGMIMGHTHRRLWDTLASGRLGGAWGFLKGDWGGFLWSAGDIVPLVFKTARARFLSLSIPSSSCIIVGHVAFEPPSFFFLVIFFEKMWKILSERKHEI